MVGRRKKQKKQSSAHGQLANPPMPEPVVPVEKLLEQCQSNARAMPERTLVVCEIGKGVLSVALCETNFFGTASSTFCRRIV